MLFFRNRQRRKVTSLSFPEQWEKLLAHDARAFQHLTPVEQNRLRQHIQIFLAEKSFEGCHGLQITDSMRINIAAYACLLLINIDHDYYPSLGSIVLYPCSFAVPVQSADETGVVTEAIEERLGESWQEGTVVLAWDSVREVVERQNRGLNVILHEFAHQLDAERGISVSSTLMNRKATCKTWSELCSCAYAREKQARRRGRPEVLDPYGSSGPEEFFAVATETFFEQPLRLKAHHAELYEELQAIYRQNPVRCFQREYASPAIGEDIY